MLLASLKKLEAKGRHETAKKCRSFASRVFRYAVATGRCASDPAQLLQGALITPKARHYAAILEPAKVGQLLRAIEAFSGSPVTMAALRIAPHVFVRPGELRHAEWAEFDLTAGVWKLPAARMAASVLCHPGPTPVLRPAWVGWPAEANQRGMGFRVCLAEEIAGGRRAMMGWPGGPTHQRF